MIPTTAIIILVHDSCYFCPCFWWIIVAKDYYCCTSVSKLLKTIVALISVCFDQINSKKSKLLLTILLLLFAYKSLALFCWEAWPWSHFRNCLIVLLIVLLTILVFVCLIWSKTSIVSIKNNKILICLFYFSIYLFVYFLIYTWLVLPPIFIYVHIFIPALIYSHIYIYICIL